MRPSGGLSVNPGVLQVLSQRRRHVSRRRVHRGGRRKLRRVHGAVRDDLRRHTKLFSNPARSATVSSDEPHHWCPCVELRRQNISQ